MIRRFMGIGGLVGLLACASGPGPIRQQPQVDPFATATRAYPPDRFLVGTGTGSTLELARRRALVGISSQIKGSVWAEGTITAEAAQGVGSAAGGAYDREEIREEIRVETSLERTEWVQVVSTRRDEAGRFAVLAVLDRGAASKQLLQELGAKRAAVASKLLALESAGIIEASLAARDLAKERDEVIASLALLTSLTRSPQSPPEELLAIDAFESELRKRWSALTWEVCLSEAAQSEDLGGRLAARGLRILPCGAVDDEAPGEVWTLSGTLQGSFQRMSQPGGYPVFCSTRLSYRLEGASGILEGGGEAKGLRSGGMEPQEACAASVDRLVDELLLQVGAPR